MIKIVQVSSKPELDKILKKEGITEAKSLTVVISKSGVFISKNVISKEIFKDPLFDISEIAVNTGIKDLAHHHNHYLYGVSKDKE